MNKIVSGLIAAVPLSLIAVAYMIFRGKTIISLVSNGDTAAESLTEQQWYFILLFSMALAPLVFGLIASMVYGLVGQARIYLIIALGLASLLSIVAWISRTPMPLVKTIMNYLVAIDLGLLVPFLSGL